MQIEQGFEVFEKLSHWDKLLEEWATCISLYCTTYEGKDTPFWNKQIANTGILSGAAWRCGWIGLMEWRNQKRGDIRERNDLLVTSQYADDYIEAEITEIYPTNVNRVDNSLRAAYNSALLNFTYPSSKSVNKVAVVYCGLRVRSREFGNTDDSIKRAIDQMKQHRRWDALSWCFPSCIRDLFDDDGSIVPGIILVAKVVE
jgi:hypothetical protein